MCDDVVKSLISVPVGSLSRADFVEDMSVVLRSEAQRSGVSFYCFEVFFVAAPHSAYLGVYALPSRWARGTLEEQLGRVYDAAAESKHWVHGTGFRVRYKVDAGGGISSFTPVVELDFDAEYWSVVEAERAAEFGRVREFYDGLRYKGD